MSARGTVLVTGASTGIGRATALHLASLGFRVLGGVRDPADAAALRPAVEGVRCDITQPEQVAAIAAGIDGAGLAGLVNNAGIVVGGPLETIDLEDFRRQLEVNLVAHLRVTQAMLPALRAGHGRIVNVGSIGGRFALPYMAPYTTSKAALRSLTDSLRQELHPFGIRVSLVEPGSVATEIWCKGDATADAVAESLDGLALERYGAKIAAMKRVSARTARQAIPPERAAKVIAHALTADRPRPHYLVGADARIQNALGKLGPRVTDRLIRLGMRF